MNWRDKIEETHGMWELAIVRLATMIEVGAPASKICEAVKDERTAFNQWATVTAKAVE